MQVVRIYWRDIPSQIIVKKGRQRAKCMLPAHFQRAVNRAAMRAGKGSSTPYIDDWRRETTVLQSELELPEFAEQQAAQFADSVSDSELDAMIKNKGYAISLPD